MLIGLLSAKGAPGVTTSSLAIAAQWPGPRSWLDADPSGGDIAAGLGRGAWPAGVSSAGARGALPHRSRWRPRCAPSWSVRASTPRWRWRGLGSPAQAAAVPWATLGRGLARLDTVDVVCDLGRYLHGGGNRDLAEVCDRILVVTRSTPARGPRHGCASSTSCTPGGSAPARACWWWRRASPIRPTRSPRRVRRRWSACCPTIRARRPCGVTGRAPGAACRAVPCNERPDTSPRRWPVLRCLRRRCRLRPGRSRHDRRRQRRWERRREWCGEDRRSGPGVDRTHPRGGGRAAGPPPRPRPARVGRSTPTGAGLDRGPARRGNPAQAGQRAPGAAPRGGGRSSRRRWRTSSGVWAGCRRCWIAATSKTSTSSARSARSCGCATGP